MAKKDWFWMRHANQVRVREEWERLREEGKLRRRMWDLQEQDPEQQLRQDQQQQLPQDQQQQLRRQQNQSVTEKSYRNTAYPYISGIDEVG